MGVKVSSISLKLK